MRVAVALAGQLVAQKARVRPAHMRKTTLLGRLQQSGRGFATGRTKQGQGGLPGQVLQSAGGLAQAVAILLGAPLQVLSSQGAGTGADAKAHIPRAIEVGPPIRVFPGVRGKSMAFGPACTPPGGPVLTEGAIALLGFFVRRKKSHRHFVALQHLGNQRGCAHVTGVEGEVHRAGAGSGLCRARGRGLGLGRCAGQGAQRQPDRWQPTTAVSVSCAAHGPKSRPRAATCPPALAAATCASQCRSRSICVTNARPPKSACHLP